MARFVEALRKLVDPRGPLGEIASPSEIFKTRMGLSTHVPHVQRAVPPAPKHVEQALAPARFVPLSEAVDVPKDRVRQVSAFIEERWAPEYRKTTSTDLVEILRASQEQIGWTVTQHQTAASRARQKREDEEVAEILASLQVQATDDFYNQYYETIPGNDPVIIDGEVLRAADGTVIRGGTRITGGRKEYNAKTKGFIHWDAGFMAQRDAAIAEEASRPVRNVRRAMEVIAGEKLPMHRPVGINYRKDRRSAV